MTRWKWICCFMESLPFSTWSIDAQGGMQPQSFPTGKVKRWSPRLTAYGLAFTARRESSSATAKPRLPSQRSHRNIVGAKASAFTSAPPGQHAPYIERRGDVLRQTFVRLIEQCEKQSLNIPPEQILAEAVFLWQRTDNGKRQYSVQRGVRTNSPHIAISRPDQLPGRERAASSRTDS